MSPSLNRQTVTALTGDTPAASNDSDCGLPGFLVGAVQCGDDGVGKPMGSKCPECGASHALIG